MRRPFLLDLYCCGGGEQHFGNTAAWREAMGIDWLPASKLKEAVPPAYSEHIGKALIAAASIRRAAMVDKAMHEGPED